MPGQAVAYHPMNVAVAQAPATRQIPAGSECLHRRREGLNRQRGDRAHAGHRLQAVCRLRLRGELLVAPA